MSDITVTGVDLVRLRLDIVDVPSDPERDGLRDFWTAYICALNDADHHTPIALGEIATKNYLRTRTLIDERSQPGWNRTLMASAAGVQP
jgi:hypothetical protein